jgi:N-acyl-D-amino-acid deacylase
MNEDNLLRQMALPWVSFASDEDARGIDGGFLKSSAHPRAHGNFARLYARHVRDKKLMPVEEAVQDDLPSGDQPRNRATRHA